MATLPCLSENRSGDELTTKFVLDVNPDNIIKALFGGREPELQGALRLEIARPPLNDSHDEWIRLALDPGRDLIPRDPLERGDLLANRGGKARHGHVAAGPDRSGIDSRGMEQETHRRSRRSMPVPDVLRDGQHRFLAGERFAQDVGKKA